MNNDNSSTNNTQQYYVFPSCSSEQQACSSPPTLGEVGGKALSLYETSANFSVPPGLVLTVSFFQPWLDRIRKTSAWKDFASAAASATENPDASADVTKSKKHCDAIMTQCKKILSLSSSQKKQLEQAIKTAFGPEANIATNLGVVAVRSSSPEEDLAGSSFAGGYETSLGVTSDTLEDAIINSFASLFDHRIYLYKVQHGMSAAITTPRIAIIVQRQIDSDVSGVGFSINPSNNCYDEVMISANFGLGESVVGGIITPDTYIVDRFDADAPSIASKRVAEKTSAVLLDTSSGGTRQEPNKDPSAQALTDEQILEVADLVARVEEDRGQGVPVDTEWAYRDGKLYLLQARPMTAYIPLFPEMVTERGGEKRLYLDIIVMTQGFSDPLSVLGLDLWRTMLARLKPHLATDGVEGLVWNLHGREYMNVSNMMATTGGEAMVSKVFRSYDKSIDRAFASIDLEDYKPSTTPEGAKGTLWKQLSQLWLMLPKMIHGLYRREEVMAGYIEGTQAIIDKCYSDDCPKDEPFADTYVALLDDYVGVTPSIMGAVLSGMISRWRLHRLFSKCEGANDYLISMCMDLNGNPTSEMGHLMVKLASFPEIQETNSKEEFLQKLNEDAFSTEFMNAYNDYIKRFGVRGMREIDAATPRTYENQGGLFETLKQIDIKNNQIINVRQRRDTAYQELLKMAKDIGKEKQFVHHAGVIQSLLGYREHPKYMIVVMIDRMRRQALNIAQDFVAHGRLESVDQIFYLNIDQVTEAQRNPDLDLLALVKAGVEPIQKVSHVKNWPVLIDSRGKIIRGIREETEAADGTLLGDPISPGLVRGRAKVLMSPYEKPLESGEILVTRFTEPSWTPLFINAAGVVLEVGGPTQHGAIIAREYGIPCVSGLDDATKLIKDGDFLEVDGSEGTVKIITEETEGGVRNGDKK